MVSVDGRRLARSLSSSLEALATGTRGVSFPISPSWLQPLSGDMVNLRVTGTSHGADRTQNSWLQSSKCSLYSTFGSVMI
jgi:hypothetical protein